MTNFHSNRNEIIIKCITHNITQPPNLFVALNIYIVLEKNYYKWNMERILLRNKDLYKMIFYWKYSINSKQITLNEWNNEKHIIFMVLRFEYNQIREATSNSNLC